MMVARVPRMHGWSHSWKPLPVFFITFVHPGRLRKDLYPRCKEEQYLCQDFALFPCGA